MREYWGALAAIAEDPFCRVVLDASLKGIAVLGASAVVTLGLRRGSASARHLVWVLAIAGAFGLPFLSALLPAWTVLLPQSWAITQAVPVALAMGPATPVISGGRLASCVVGRCARSSNGSRVSWA